MSLTERLGDFQPMTIREAERVERRVAERRREVAATATLDLRDDRVQRFPIRHDPGSGRFLPEGGAGSAKEPAAPPDPDHYSKKQAEAFIDEGWSDWRGDLTTGQRHMVEDYTSDTRFVHYNMNAYLRGTPRRGGSKPPTKSMVGHKVKQLDGAFEHDSARVPHDVTVHRGLHGELGAQLHAASKRGTLVGGTLKDPGFTSTSLDRRIARKFATGEGTAGPGEKVLLNFKLKAGDRAIAPGRLARRHAGEAEVILPRDQKFTITGSRNRGGVLEVDLEAVRG